MNGLLLTLHISVSILIIFIVLSQVGRGAELGAAFGSSGQANSPRTVGNFLTKLTTWLATIFMLTSITLSIMTARSANNSVLNSVSLKKVQKTVTTKTTDSNTTKAVDSKSTVTKTIDESSTTKTTVPTEKTNKSKATDTGTPAQKAEKTKTEDNQVITSTKQKNETQKTTPSSK